MLGILRGNQGFEDPERWVEYGLRHAFAHVSATKLKGCPGCGAKGSHKIGQYVYFSTLLNLVGCAGCGLAYSDVRLDPAVVQRHFEKTYKDEDYFATQRKKIFDHLVSLVDQLAPRGGYVVDVGGAKGHLMALLRERRPDLHVAVSDISRTACEWVESHYGMEAICCDAATLVTGNRVFDVLVVSDTLYYEPHLRRFWENLPGVLRAGGAVVIRVPSKYRLIRVAQAVRSLTGLLRRLKPQADIRYFNPEHLYVFTRRYLERQLGRLGFASVSVGPSPMLAAGVVKRLAPVFFRLAGMLHTVSFGAIVATPSMVVVGRLSPGTGGSVRAGDE
jgi:SAM-dependent methyltransferase